MNELIKKFLEREDLSPAEKIIAEDYKKTRHEYEQATKFLGELERQAVVVKKKADDKAAIGKALENMIIKLAGASEGEDDGAAGESDDEKRGGANGVLHEGDSLQLGGA